MHQTIFGERLVGFGNLRRCGTLLYPSAVRCGAVQGFSNGLKRTYAPVKEVKVSVNCLWRFCAIFGKKFKSFVDN